MSFKFCNHFDGEKELVVYFNCLPNVLELLAFCGSRSSSRYNGLYAVCDCGIS